MLTLFRIIGIVIAGLFVALMLVVTGYMILFFVIKFWAWLVGA